MKKYIFFVFILLTLLCSCNSDHDISVPAGTLRIVGIGASGSEISISNPIDFAENDVYYAMQAFGKTGERAGYSNIKYYEYFPEQKIDDSHKVFNADQKYDNYGSLITSLTNEEFSDDDLTIVLISSHGGYDEKIVENGDTYALENGYIMTVDKSGNVYKKTRLTFTDLNTDLNKLKGTVLAIVQVCYSGGIIVGDSVIANTDVYPDASVFENLFKTGTQPISDHVFYLCSCPYYSESVGTLKEHSYFFSGVLKALGMSVATHQMGDSIPASVRGALTLSDLTRYVTNNGGLYDGTLNSKKINQFPVVSGGSSDLEIFKFY